MKPDLQLEDERTALSKEALKGAFLDDHPLQLGGVGVTGGPAASGLARDADLVICVGTRLTDFATGSHSLFQHPDVRFASINELRSHIAKNS